MSHTPAPSAAHQLNLVSYWATGSDMLTKLLRGVGGQTRAVSLRNRQIAPPAKTTSHAATLSTQAHWNESPVSGAWASDEMPYIGVNCAIFCSVEPSSSGTNSPPAKARMARPGPMICMTFSLGRRYPRKRPNAAKTSDPAHAMSAVATHSPTVSICALVNAPMTKTTRTASAPSSMAVSSLTNTYATGDNGV